MKPVTVYAIDGLVPVVDASSFVHPTAVLIGDVIVGAGCYIGPCACLRGDFGRLIVKAGVNVQDTCVVHTFPGRDSVIEEDGHIGHGAVLHGCAIGRNALVGMNAVVMDNAIVGESAMVAACSFVKAGMEIPPRTLAGGVPARIMRAVSSQELAWKSEGTRAYQNLTRRCLATMVAVEPLTAPEPGRERIVIPEVKPLSELHHGHQS